MHLTFLCTGAQEISGNLRQNESTGLRYPKGRCFFGGSWQFIFCFLLLMREFVQAALSVFKEACVTPSAAVPYTGVEEVS